MGLNVDKEACQIVFLYESLSQQRIEDDSSCLSGDDDWSCGGGYDKFQWGQDFDLEIIIVRWGTMLWGTMSWGQYHGDKSLSGEWGQMSLYGEWGKWRV